MAANSSESEDDLLRHEQRQRSPLWAVPAEGGRETAVLDSVSPGTFALTRDGIYNVSRPGLQYFSFATGTSRPILTLDKPRWAWG